MFEMELADTQWDSPSLLMVSVKTAAVLQWCLNQQFSHHKVVTLCLSYIVYQKQIAILNIVWHKIYKHASIKSVVAAKIPTTFLAVERFTVKKGQRCDT